MLNKKSFTLIELLVVVIIIGILAALAMPGFGVTKEKVLDREANASLALIQAAEKIYRMEVNSYYPYSGNEIDIAKINPNLKISLPTGGTLSWDYVVHNNKVTATRKVPGGRVWTLTYSGNTSCCSGSDCPSGTGCP